MSRIVHHAGLLLHFFLMTLATAFTILFGLFKLLNLLDIRFFLLYSPKTVNITMFSSNVDLSIWVVSLLLVALQILLMKMLQDAKFPRWTILPFALLLVSLGVFRTNPNAAYFIAVPAGAALAGLSIYYGQGYLVTGRKEAAAVTLSWVMGFLAFFELASATSWAVNAIDYEVPFGPGIRWAFPTFDLQVFNVFYPLTSWLLLLFLYSWIWIPIVNRAFSRVTALKRARTKVDQIFSSSNETSGTAFKLNRKHVAVILFISLVTAAFIAYYPYFHLSNSILVGSDSTEYYSALNDVGQKGPLTAFDTDRPLPILLMCSLQYLTGSAPETILRIMPAILAVCLCLAVYWLVKVGTENEVAALFSSVFSSFSFQVTVGLFSYFIANWLAIIESLVMLGLLLKGFQGQSWKYMAASAVMGIAVLLTHPYTWDVLMIILVFYLAWAFMQKKVHGKQEALLLTLILAFNLVFYVGYALAPFGKSLNNAEAANLHDVSSGISLTNLLNLPSNLASVVQSYVGGLFGNPLLILLAIVGVSSMFDFAKRFNRIMLLWVMIPSLALLAVAVDPYYYRFIYVIPIQIQAALGLIWIVRKLRSAMGWFRYDRNLFVFNLLTVMLVVLLMLNYALRSADEAVIHLL